MRNFSGVKFNEKIFEHHITKGPLQIQYHPFPPPSPRLNFKSRLRKLGTIPNYDFFFFLSQYVDLNVFFDSFEYDPLPVAI